MPRKSNKTEQVLRLITKSGDHEDAVKEELEVAGQEPGVSEPEDLVSQEMPEAAEEAVPEPGSFFMDDEEKERLKAELKEEIRKEFTETLMEQPKKSEPVPEPEPEPEPIFDAVQPAYERELTADGPTPMVHKQAPPIRRQNDYEIVNLSELLAAELMPDVMKKLNVCDCPLCKADVMALTLNHLPQKYVTTDAGKQFTQLNMYRKQYETDVLSELTRACVRVKGSPRHS